MIDIDTDYDAPQQVLPLDHPFVVEALTRLARDVPADVEIGRIRLAVFDPHEYAVNFPTALGVFSSHFGHAERLTSIGEGIDEIAESTSWTGKLETDRIARRIADLVPQSAVE